MANKHKRLDQIEMTRLYIKSIESKWLVDLKQRLNVVVPNKEHATAMYKKFYDQIEIELYKQ